MALGYKIALTNVWWNRGGQDTRLFQNTTERETYFSNKGLYFNDLVNFNINDNITTTIIFRDKSGRTAEELIKCNYAVVWNTTANTYRYYFILDIKQDSNNQVMASLDLDDVITNLVPNLNNIGNVKVKRWTGINYRKALGLRYYSIGTNVVSYLSEGKSPLLYNQNTDVIKIKQKGDTAIDNWLYDNVLAWDYLFINSNNQILVPDYTPNQWARKGIKSNCIINQGGRGTFLPYGSLSVPIYKTNKRIYFKYYDNLNTYFLVLSPNGIDTLGKTQFWEQGHQDPSYNEPWGTYGIEKKLSNICPLKFYDYEIDADGDLIITAKLRSGYSPVELVDGDNNFLDYNCIYMSEGNPQTTNTAKSSAYQCVVSGYIQENATYDAVGNHSLHFTAVPENGNVKILDKEFSKIRLRIANQHYDYNPLSLGVEYNTPINLKYTEVLKAGLSKIYLRVKTKDNCLYTTQQEEDYTGLITSLDLTEPLLTNQWADYFANHKNYYLQTMFNNTLGLTKGVASTIVSSDELSASKNSLNTGSNYWGAIINQELDKDNMMQAPDGLSNANGDPYFAMAVSDIRPRLDTYQVKSTTKEAILDDWARNGITYERIMDFSTIILSHQSYEALAVIIDKIGANLSTKEFNRLREYMSTIHRYWHTDTFTLENPYIL